VSLYPSKVEYANLLHNNHFLLSMLKTVVLLNSFVETEEHYFDE